MAITVQVQDAAVSHPVVLKLTDRSGAHVELTLLIGNEPPISHAFAFTEGTVTVPLPKLKVGKHRCTLVVQAFKHKQVLNREYDVACAVGQRVVASAQGKIASGSKFDVGAGDFVLDVS